MPRDGSLVLSGVRAPTLTIVCGPCGRHGQYNVERLMAEHGDAKLTDLLQTLADCPKTRSASIHDRCKAVYEGLGLGGALRTLPEALNPLGQRLRTRPSAASIAALYPPNAWSLGTTPLVRGFSSRLARKAATAYANSPMSTQMCARCFAQVSCSSRLFMRSKVWDALASGRVPGGPGRYRLAAAAAASEAFAGLGTARVSGKASTLTSAERPQLAQVAVTARTPFWRMLVSDIGHGDGGNPGRH